MADLLLVKRAAALAASKALCKYGFGQDAGAVLAVEDAVEEACLELRLQTRFHEETPPVWRCCRCHHVMEEWRPWRTREHPCIQQHRWRRPYLQEPPMYRRGPRRTLVLRRTLSGRIT